MGFDWDEVERIEGAAERCAEERSLDKHVLCARCEYGTVMQRRGKLHITAYCHSLRRLVPTDLVKCSTFKAQNTLSVHDLEKLAVLIDSRKGVNDRAYL